MNKNTFTAGLIILLSLCVMGTAVLSYYYVLSVRRLARVQIELLTIQQMQTRANALSRDALGYGMSHPEILPVLELFDIRLRPVGGETNAVTPTVITNPVSEIKE